MPLISHFYGILIYIYKEIGGYHNVYNDNGEIIKIKGLE